MKTKVKMREVGQLAQNTVVVVSSPSNDGWITTAGKMDALGYGKLVVERDHPPLFVTDAWYVEVSDQDYLKVKGPPRTAKLRVRRKSSTAEWVVRVWVDGVYSEDKTYYTDDREDADDTMALMAKQFTNQGFQVI